MSGREDISPVKQQEVEHLKKLLSSHPVIAISDIKSLPAAQFQEVRSKLRGKAIIRVTKLTLLKRAMEESGVKGIKNLEGLMEGPVAIIFSTENPFKLFAFLKKNKSKSAIKTGQVAPIDLVVPKGDTGIPPGPALGELKVAGINAKIDGGSIKVMKDSTVAKAGETVSAEVAAALNKLGVKPMQVGLSLKGAIENGELFTQDILDISEEETISNIQNAYMQAFNLSVNTAYATKDNIETIIQKAFTDARNVGVNAVILNDKTIELVLAKANAEAKAIDSLVDWGKTDAPAEKPAEEKLVEEPAEKTEEKTGEGQVDQTQSDQEANA